MTERVVFVHGSGRAGVDAWPLQASLPGAVFLTRAGWASNDPPVVTDFAGEARSVVAACEGVAHVVAASYGGVIALLAAGLPDTPIRSLVLVEPAAFSLGRGLPAIETHIAAIEPVHARAAQLDAADFQVAFYTALGIPNPSRPTTEDDLLRAERTRLQRPPWEAEIDPTVVSRVPTLVVTGDWNAEYEELASRLVELGARHVHLVGYSHRAQDSPEFNAALRDFWAGVA